MTQTELPRKLDGSVNWRACVKPEHLYVKKEHEATVAKKLNKPFAEINVTEVEDRYLVIRKAGIIELARLRGYESAPPEVKHVQRDYVVVQTHITWLPFEGQPAKVTGGVGEAHFENTTKMGANYLAASAENRAFSRAVRQFLEIDIVSSDELGAQEVEPDTDAAPASTNPFSPQGALSRTATETGFTFDVVKKGALSKYRDKIKGEPEQWTKFEDISPLDCNTLIALLREAAAKDRAGKAKAG